MFPISTTVRCVIGGALIGSLLWILNTQTVSADLPGTQRERSLQSLALSPEGVFGHYFQVDPDSGEFSLNLDSDQNNSGSYWKIDLVHRHRDYARTYSIKQRGNGVYNGWYLSVNKETGELQLAPDRESWTCKWRIRYAGKHHGYDAFVIQNIGETGESDMKFLSLDPVSKKPRLSRELDDAGYWFVDVVSDLPTDF